MEKSCQGDPTKGGTTKGGKNGKGNAYAPESDRAPQRPWQMAAAARAGGAMDVNGEGDAALQPDAVQDGGEQAAGAADGGADDEGFRYVGKKGRWAQGPPKHFPNNVKGGGKQGAAPQLPKGGGKGQGAQPPDLSREQAKVERDLGMCKVAKHHADSVLAYMQGEAR